MNVKLLIDAIVQQTTVLIAQLSTAAGLRAPLAHVADQVFVELSRELEAQGLGRKVVADMFGMALRLNELWNRVCAHNDKHPLSEEERVRVRFYFGQNVIASDGDAAKTGEAQ